jgi:heme-degrading monooxygenase HmoA
MSDFASLPEPPYFAVIFSSLRTPGDAGYADMAERMVALAAGQEGFLGVESTRGDNGFGITVSYWRDLESIAAWRRHAEHRVAQELGRGQWYGHYELRVARVERAHGGPA